jgi:hypothetical protein
MHRTEHGMIFVGIFMFGIGDLYNMGQLCYWTST